MQLACFSSRLVGQGLLLVSHQELLQALDGHARVDQLADQLGQHEQRQPQHLHTRSMTPLSACSLLKRI